MSNKAGNDWEIPLPQIESGIKPWRKCAGTGELAALRRTLILLNEDQSFVWPRLSTSPYKAAKQLGFKIITRKVMIKNNKGLRIWKLRQ